MVRARGTQGKRSRTEKPPYAAAFPIGAGRFELVRGMRQPRPRLAALSCVLPRKTIDPRIVSCVKSLGREDRSPAGLKAGRLLTVMPGSRGKGRGHTGLPHVRAPFACLGSHPTCVGRVFRPRCLNLSSAAAPAIRVLASDELIGFASSAITSRPSVFRPENCRLLASLASSRRFGRPTARSRQLAGDHVTNARAHGLVRARSRYGSQFAVVAMAMPKG